MKINLKNPIIFFDLETTGINIITDRVIEIAILKIFPNGNEEMKKYRVNPEIPIPESSSAIHRIFDEDVKNCPTFKQIAHQIANFMEDCDIAGFNSNQFDIPLLAEEFLRANIDFDMAKRKFVDVQNIFHKKERRDLVAAYKFYCNKELEDAHNAETDTRATYEVLKAQIEKYKDLQNDIDFLAEFSKYHKNVDFVGRIIYNEKNEEIFNFGKYKGQKVTDVLLKDPGYYGWMMNGVFPLYTKKVLTEIKLRSFGGK